MSGSMDRAFRNGLMTTNDSTTSAVPGAGAGAARPPPPVPEYAVHDADLAVSINGLTFGYGSERKVLNDLNLHLTKGSRCLLIGQNGAGKSTLLRCLGGRHLVKPDQRMKMLNKSCFYDMTLNFERSYLDTDWGMRTVAFAGYGVPLQADIPVYEMMSKLQNEYPERKAELLDLLGVDLNWRMHRVSDGQRRRVQIFLGLLRPFKVLLLDEVTVSLDVVVRQDLLRWLRKESETRGATIVYATHIFDGLDDWPTHLHYLRNTGSTGWQGPLEELDLYRELRAAGNPSPLLRIAEKWLRAELEASKARNEQEQESGEAAIKDSNPLTIPGVAGGGFSAGRMASHATGLE